MYPVTELYKQKIKENNRLFETKIQIHHSEGTLEITDKDLVQGSLINSEGSQAGEEFTIGGTVASDISFTILNKSEYADIKFMGATVFCSIALLVQEGADAHFLQPSQPSKMPGFEEKWEWVPLGRFNIDDVNIQRNTIQIKAVDNMFNLDIPYTLSKLSYPATLYQIYVNACNVCDVTVGTHTFPNMNHVVQKRPEGDYTFRDIVGYVAELSGTFAKCNRMGALQLKWYTSTGLTLEPANRFDFKPSDDTVQIKGIMASTEDTTYLAGSEDYAVDLTDNPLLQSDYETVLPNIFNNVKDTVFTPYTSNWQGNPALQAGDMITQIDRDGKVHNTLVTKSIYKYRGRSTLEAKGLPDISKGYKGSTSKLIAQIKKKIDTEVGDKLTNLEQAMLEATELITSAMGGYVLKRANELLIMDNPDPNIAQKVWRWNLNGLGYSNTGIDGPYGLAMTMNGAINANYITTGNLSANMVQTGSLTSVNNKSYFNLDDGILRIAHENNAYSQMDENGFGFTDTYGSSWYLKDMELINGTTPDGGSNWNSESVWTSNVRIYLPTRFRGKDVRPYVSLNNFRMPAVGDSNVGAGLGDVEMVLRTRTWNTSAGNTTPYVDVQGYARWKNRDGDYYYRNLDFVLQVVSV